MELMQFSGSVALRSCISLMHARLLCLHVQCTATLLGLDFIKNRYKNIAWTMHEHGEETDKKEQQKGGNYNNKVDCQMNGKRARLVTEELKEITKRIQHKIMHKIQKIRNNEEIKKLENKNEIQKFLHTKEDVVQKIQNLDSIQQWHDNGMIRHKIDI